MLPDELIHECTIKESAWIPDEFAGADFDQPASIETARKCWVQPAGDSEINQFQRRSQNVTHSVFFRGNPSLKPGFIIYPTSGPFSGATLEVKSCNECTAGTGLLWKAMVEEIQPR